MKNTIKAGKKILSLVLALIMVICAVPIGASAVTEYTEGYYTYTVENGEATIIAVDKTISGDVIIPETLGGYPVTTIGDCAFEFCQFLTSVIIPDTVVIIGSGAFMGCFMLLDVKLSNNITELKDSTFSSCMSLMNITIPDSVEYIYDGTFENCISLEQVILSDNVKTIDEIFYNCISLKKLVINSETMSFNESQYGFNFTTNIDLSYMTVDEIIEHYIKMHDPEIDLDTFNKLESELMPLFLENWRILPELIIYGYVSSTAETFAKTKGIPFKTISEYEKETHTCTYGEWYTVTEATVFAEGEKRRDCECGEYETETIAKLENAVAEDTVTGVEITYTGDNFDSAVEIVVSEDAVNANIAFADEYENYKAYDISLEIDGEKVQPNGYVTVKMPLPVGYNADRTVVYYVDDNGERTLIESIVENGYIVFETNHFSEYVIVDESSKIETPVEPEISEEPDTPDEPTEPDSPSDPTEDCSCNCHKNGFMGFFWKIILFFNKLFKTNKICACGVAHY